MRYKKNKRIYSEKQLRKRRRWKRKKKIRNRLSNPNFKSHKLSQAYTSLKTKRYFKSTPIVAKIVVPADFSLITNLDNVIKFFGDCKKYNKEICDKVEFDFSNVKNIGSSSMAILLSICGWLNDHSIFIQGTYPKDLEVRSRFEKLGFLRYFRANYHNKANSESRSEIIQRGMTTTNQELTSKKIRQAMDTVYSEENKNTKIQGMLIELMANTVNHAYNKYQKGWYLALDHDEKEKCVKFSFIDNGKGILNTIKFRFKDKISSLIGFTNDGELIQQAFEGKFGSRTSLSYRGRGLPLIRKNFADGYIKKLKVISNGVYYDFTDETYKILKTEFEGTFYFWELNEECKTLSYGS